MTTLVLDPSDVPARAVGPILGPPDPSVLARNLAALSRSSPRTAELVQHCAPRTDLRFLHTDDGVPSVEVVDASGRTPARAMASRRRPLREGEQLCESIDVASTAAAAVMGFGAGYHVRALARRMKRSGVIAVFEPDAALLRAVLERIDHSEWLHASNTAVFTDPDDAAAISSALTGVEGVMMMGLTLLEHPASIERIGESRTRFYKNLQDVIAAIRTTVATTMVQTRVTVGNVARNIGWYVASPGIAHLAGTCAGAPAIVVSAGPSLQRNIAQLARPGVRERFTIIAAQTVLKPLLARGIRPHYVVALDYSEISARFYEGLSPSDVEGVTLVVEPKVSPAVPLAFPGEVLLASDPFLDLLLGPGLARDMGTLPPGATVAHLAYYLARHVGADPVVLVGQDLGFTDGQYYAANAAIHDVWACELNQFNTIERMEWERIKRMGPHLRRATDHRARPIYTDEQLATYLVQFERDFLADTHRGLSIIDATEGGVAKRHTCARTLQEVVDEALAGERAARMDATTAAVAPIGVRRAEERVREVCRGVHRVGEQSRRTAELLGEMLAHHADQRRVSRIIDEVHAVRDEVERVRPAIDLVHYLNQAGAFSRMRADRAIHLDPALSPIERQRREIERDIANVQQLARTADELAGHLTGASDSLVRWRTGGAAAPAGSRQANRSAGHPGSSSTAHAIVTVDARLLEAYGDWPLRMTIQRLQRCRRLESIVVLTPEYDATRAALGDRSRRVPVNVRHEPRLFGPEYRLMEAARAPASECWRGGLGGASVFDEALAPEATLRVMDELNIQTVLIVRHDWCLVDPAMCDEIIERSGRATGTHRLAFSQAPPGVAGIALNRAVMADLASLRRGSSPFATIGGLLSYMPSAPAADPIGRDVCIPMDAALRDIGRRLIPDSPARALLIRRAIEETGVDADAETIAGAVERYEDEGVVPPSSLTLESSIVEALPVGLVAGAVEEFVRGAPRGLLTIRDDASDARNLQNAVRTVRAAGAASVHVRTAFHGGADPTGLPGLDAEIISIDLPMPTDEVSWARACHQLESLSAALRERPEGRPRAWIVPRLTKCDASYSVLEEFFDRSLLATGAACIDRLPAAGPPGRIEPLPIPESARRRFARTVMYVRADGNVWADDFFERGAGASPSATLRERTFEEAWRVVVAARRAHARGCAG